MLPGKPFAASCRDVWKKGGSYVQRTADLALLLRAVPGDDPGLGLSPPGRGAAGRGFCLGVLWEKRPDPGGGGSKGGALHGGDRPLSPGADQVDPGKGP